jgi:SAM-dependent methyltransferase
MSVTSTTVQESSASADCRACPACAQSNFADVGSVLPGGFRRRRCRECDLVFSSPMRGAGSDWYASSWMYGLRESGSPSMEAEARIPWNFAQALAELRVNNGGRLLDVGCAEGHFLKLARQKGCDVTGLDFNPVSVGIARERVGHAAVHQYSVEELRERFPGIQFDVITLFEVLEHTSNPFEIVCSIHKLLKPEGRLFLSVPGNRRWPALFHPEVDTPPHHLTLWTEEGLKRLLDRAGFRVRNVVAKPLGAEDMGLHLKWRLHQMMKKLRPTPSRFGAVPVGKAEKAPSGDGKLEGINITRAVGMLVLTPVCWALRMNLRAGGFTLFAHCETT